MNVMTTDTLGRLVTLGIEPGEMLLESIQAGLAEAGITNGVVISGIGTLKTAHLHYVTHTGFPSNNEFIKLEKPLELLSVSGIIADGKPHLHVAMACGKDETYGGHLEPESEVLYLAEIAILECNALKMTRRKGDRGTSILQPE